MKFTGKFMTILSVAVASALPLDKRGLVELPKSCSRKIDQLFMNYSQKGCDAMSTINSMNDEQINLFACDSFKTKVCAEFYYIDYFDLPECKNANALALADVMHYKNLQIETISHRCTKDEKGRNCPLTFNNFSDQNIIRTCESKICTSDAITYLNAVIGLNNQLNNYYNNYNKKHGTNAKVSFDSSYSPSNQENIRNYLKSAKCDAHRKPKQNAAKDPKPTPPAEDPKPTPPAAEDPKPTPPAAEDPKPTSPAEDPKPTPPVAEDPKPTPPAAEDPKPTPPAAEDPKPTPSAAEDPKPTPPAAEDPKPTPPAAEDPKPTPPAAEDPKPTPPAAEDPKPTPSSSVAVEPKPITSSGEESSDDEKQNIKKNRKCIVKPRKN